MIDYKAKQILFNLLFYICIKFKYFQYHIKNLQLHDVPLQPFHLHCPLQHTIGMIILIITVIILNLIFVFAYPQSFQMLSGYNCIFLCKRLFSIFTSVLLQFSAQYLLQSGPWLPLFYPFSLPFSQQEQFTPDLAISFFSFGSTFVLAWLISVCICEQQRGTNISIVNQFVPVLYDNFCLVLFFTKANWVSELSMQFSYISNRHLFIIQQQHIENLPRDKNGDYKARLNYTNFCKSFESLFSSQRNNVYD